MIVEITTDSPNIVFGIAGEKMVVTVDLKKDGIDGKSAYEIAVENGYTGSEGQWIADLQKETIDGGLIF